MLLHEWTVKHEQNVNFTYEFVLKNQKIYHKDKFCGKKFNPNLQTAFIII